MIRPVCGLAVHRKKVKKKKKKNRARETPDTASQSGAENGEDTTHRLSFTFVIRSVRERINRVTHA